jgi:hypothetical membrane protein
VISDPTWQYFVATVLGMSGRTRKGRQQLIAGCVLVLCALQTQAAHARGLSTAAERAQVVARMRALEQNPLAPDAPATRQQLRQWMIDVPEIRFRFCAELLGHAMPPAYSFAQEINMQVAFSGAVFTIEHPEGARDELAVDRAGVEGALRVYERLLGSRPEARLAFLDDLVAKRERGELDDYVVKLAEAKCETPHRDQIAWLVGTAAGLLLGIVVARLFGRREAARGVAPADVAAVTRGSSRIVTTCRRIVFFCVAYFAIAVAALHLHHPDLDPRFHFMSEYLFGDYGWLMLTAFFALGLAPLALALELREVHQASWSARVGFGLLIVAGLFVWLAGVFEDFPIHLVASAVAIPCILMAAVLVSWSLRQAAHWRGMSRVPLVTSLAMLAFFLLMVADIGLPGLEQRAFIGMFLTWLAIVAWRLASIRVSGG